MPTCGSIDHRCSAGASVAQARQEHFKMLYTFFERMKTVGNCTRIALQYGLSGTGTDWWDGANPFQYNAFAVYHFGSATKPFDVLIQFGHQATLQYFGLTPGNPGAINGVSSTGYGSGIAMAAREDGTSPWAGTTGNAGADTKGATVWTPGTSTLYVLDKACATGGSFATNKENCVRVGGTTNPLTAGAGRVHMVGNQNGFAILTDYAGSGYYGSAVIGGIYTPRTGLSSTHTSPLFLLGYSAGGSNGVFPHGTSETFGSAAGTTVYEGGILGRPADGVGAISPILPFSELAVSLAQPNEQPTAGAEYDICPIGLFYKDAVRYGYVGSFDPSLIGITYEVPNLQTNDDATRAYMATITAAAEKYAIPWDGYQAPGNNVTREGRQF